MTENEADSLSAALDRFGATALAIKAERGRMEERRWRSARSISTGTPTLNISPDGPSPVGNEEMHVLVAVRTALGGEGAMNTPTVSTPSRTPGPAIRRSRASLRSPAAC